MDFGARISKIRRWKSAIRDPQSEIGMLPPHLAPFFWDIDTETFDPHSYPDYTIGRLLEFGDENAVAWLRQAFSEAEITRVLRTERRLSPRSAHYWALVFGIPADEVRALREKQTGVTPEGEGENAGDP